MPPPKNNNKPKTGRIYPLQDNEKLCTSPIGCSDFVSKQLLMNLGFNENNKKEFDDALKFFKKTSGVHDDAWRTFRHIENAGGDIKYQNIEGVPKKLNKNLQFKVGDVIGLHNDYNTSTYQNEANKKNLYGKNAKNVNTHVGFVDKIDDNGNAYVLHYLGRDWASNSPKYKRGLLKNKNGKYKLDNDVYSVTTVASPNYTNFNQNYQKEIERKKNIEKEYDNYKIPSEILNYKNSSNPKLESIFKDFINNYKSYGKLSGVSPKELEKLFYISLGEAEQETKSGNSGNSENKFITKAVVPVGKLGRVVASNIGSTINNLINYVSGEKKLLAPWERQILIDKDVEKGLIPKNKVKDKEFIKEYINDRPDKFGYLSEYDEDYTPSSKGFFRAKHIGDIAKGLNIKDDDIISNPEIAFANTLLINSENYNNLKNKFKDKSEQDLMYLTAHKYNSSLASNPKFVEHFLPKKNIDYSNKVYNHAKKLYNYDINSGKYDYSKPDIKSYIKNINVETPVLEPSTLSVKKEIPIQFKQQSFKSESVKPEEKFNNLASYPMSQFANGGPIKQYADGGSTVITSNAKGGNRISFTGDPTKDDWINKQIDTGKFGYNTKTGTIIKLDKPQEGLSTTDKIIGSKKYAQSTEAEKFAVNPELRKQYIQRSNEEAFKNPLMASPGMIGMSALPVGFASAYGLTSALGNLGQGNYKTAALEAGLSALPFIGPEVKTIKSALTNSIKSRVPFRIPQRNVLPYNNQLPPPPSEIQFMPDGTTRTVYSQNPTGWQYLDNTLQTEPIIPTQIRDMAIRTGVNGFTRGTPEWNVIDDIIRQSRAGNYKPKLTLNKSGLSKEEALAKASSKDKDIISKMSEEEFSNTVSKPTGEIVPYEFNKKAEGVIDASHKEYADEFNRYLDDLNDIINNPETGTNTSGIKYHLKGMDESGNIIAYTPKQTLPDGRIIEEGTQNLGFKIRKPGFWRGDIEDIASHEYINSIPGLRAYNTSSGVFPEGSGLRGTPGTGLYDAVNKYLKRYDLGRLSDGASGQSKTVIDPITKKVTTGSFDVWEGNVKKNKAVGFYSNPNQVSAIFRTIVPYLGAGYLGYEGLQGQEEATQQQKYGGNIPMKLNKYNYGGYMYSNGGKLYPLGGSSILTQSNLKTGEALAKENTVLDKESILNTQPIISNNEINKNTNTTNISSPVDFNIPSFQSKKSSFDNSNFTGSFNSNPIVGETSNFSKSLDNSFTKIDSAPSIQAPAPSDPLITIDTSNAPPPVTSLDQLGQGPELNANTSLNFTAPEKSKKPLNSSGVYSGNYAGMASAAASGIANTINNVNQAKTSDDKFNAGTKGSVDTVMNVVDTAFPIVGMVESAASVAPTISNMTNPKTTVYDKKTNKSYTYQTGKNGDVAAAWSAVGSPRDNFSNAIGSFAGTKENYGMNDVAMGIADMFVPFLSEGVRNKKAREAAQSANVNQLNPEEYNRSMKVSSQARYGGKMFSYGGNIYAGGGMAMYNMPKGLTHEQHPYGGYPIGNNNFVESDEVILDKPDGSKYIFSNRLRYK